jgi:hypothetical protein
MVCFWFGGPCVAAVRKEIEMKKLMLFGCVVGVGSLMSGCWATLHNVVIHGAEIIQTWGALNQLGIV